MVMCWMDVTPFSNCHPALHGPSPRELPSDSPLTPLADLPVPNTYKYSLENQGSLRSWTGGGPVESRVFCCSARVAKGQGALLGGSRFTPEVG